MSHAGSIRGLVTASLLALALASCGDDGGDDGSSDDAETNSVTPTPAAPLELWPAPENPLALATEAGLEPDVIEHLDYHSHTHLDVFVDGQPVLVPAGIGIVIDDPAVHEFQGPLGTGYGGIEPPGCDQPCISPLHTHDPDGVLHTESATPKGNTLGQFFIAWDLVLSEECVAEYCVPDTEILFYVDGELYEGDPNEIELTDGREIAVVIGIPPDEIPDSFNFDGV